MAEQQQYTEAERRAVLVDVLTLGSIEAAAGKHGIRQEAIGKWFEAAVVQANRPARPEDTETASPGLSLGKRRSYTEEARREVLGDVPALGLSGAARKHGVPKGTVSNWCKKNDTEKGAATERNAEEEAGVAVETTKKANKKRRVARKYTPSEKAEILEYASEHGPTEAWKKYGASRFSIYGWQRQVARAAGGEGESPTSGEDPSSIEAQRDQEILNTWHRHPGLGPSQVRNQLRRGSVKVSVQTVRRVMEEAGYRPPKVEHKQHDERFESVRPNHMWHLDYVHQHINRASTYTLILIDDHSRFVVGHGVDDAERADLVVETFEEAVRRYGRPEMVMHDRGSAFWSWRGISRFTKLLVELGVDQIAAEHKELNGKVEVFNANLQKELFKVHRFHDVAEMKRRLASHLWWYNHERTHHALGGLLVPADRYYGRADEVLARIEAGAGRDGLDVLDLRDRSLELFKVVSKNGVPEIWLMGQRVFEMRA